MSCHSAHVFRVCLRARALALCLLAVVAWAVPARAQSAGDPVYVFHTNLGDMRVQLFPDVTPKTVANFLNYVNKGAYSNSIIHRSVSGFIVQGGGFQVQGDNNNAIPADPAVVNEFHLSNVRGTIAMAKLGNDPNSATNQWFFNLADNSSNLDKQNGGFTVFGKVADAASLAVMDRIAAIPVYDASGYYKNGALNQLPIINQQGNTVSGDELVTVTSITPLPAWTATSLSAGTDGFTRVLWDRSNGAVALWKVDAGGNVVANVQYGPYDGWTALAIATTKDGNTHVLWVNADGQIILWLVDANNNYVSQQSYGPYSGWSPQSLTAAPDGSLRLLWDNTDGRATLWTVDAGNNYQGQQSYGPYDGWTARSVTVGADGLARLLWTNVSGAATVWQLDAQSSFVSRQQYGPYNGWTANSVAAAPNGTGRVVWVNGDGRIALWGLDAQNSYTGQNQYGPFSGWGFQAISVGADGNARLLWDSVGGQADLWDLTPGGQSAAFAQFGPY